MFKDEQGCTGSRKIRLAKGEGIQEQVRLIGFINLLFNQ